MELVDRSTDEQLYRKAKEQARNIRGFYINLTAYCSIIRLLIFINLTFTPDFYWFFFSMSGWGIGLCFHAMSAFGRHPFLGKEWEARKIKEYMEIESRKQNCNNN